MPAVRSRRQLEFSGHIMRKECLENLMLTGRMKGRKSEERKITDNILEEFGHVDDKEGV